MKSKGAEAKLCYLGHLMKENRNSLVVNTRVTLAAGTAERDAAVAMADKIPGGGKRVTVGADRGYDTGGFVQSLRDLNVTPHVAQHTNGRSRAKVGWMFTFAAAAYNLVRMRNLAAAC